MGLSSCVLRCLFSAGWGDLLVLEHSAGMSCLQLLDSEAAMLVKLTLKTGGSGEVKQVVVFLQVVSVPKNWLVGAPTCADRFTVPTGLAELLPCPACPWLEPWCGGGLGNRARGTSDGSRGKKLSANREFFFCDFFSDLICHKAGRLPGS